MKAYYNEIDKYCVEWLRNLIAEGLIADGDLDDRSIVDVRPNDLRGYTQCHFFAGLGGWPGALRLADWPDNRAVWTGSCPCQPFSLAGRQGGFADERHLWPDWFYLIEKCRPAIVFGEQVASAGEWLRLVRGDLETLDYAVGCMPIQAASAGADHLRDRLWFVADADDTRSQGWQLLSERASKWLAGPDGMGYPESIPQRESHNKSHAFATDGEARSISSGAGDHLDWVIGADGKARRVKSGIRLLAHGVPNRVAKLRALGNAIDLRPAAAFIKACA